MEKVCQYFCIFCDFTNINIVLSFNHYKTHMYMKDNCEICDNQLSSRVSQPNGECDHSETQLSFGEVQRKIKVIEAWINEFLVYQNKLIDKTFSELLLSDRVCMECAVCRYLVDNYKKNGGEMNQIQYINAQSIEQHCYKQLRYSSHDSQEIRLLEVFIKECCDTAINDDNTLEVVCYPSSDFTDTSSHVSTERNEHISPISLGFITLKLNMNETKLNKTNFELEEIKSDFNKKITIKDEEIEKLNTKITEFERSMTSILECFDIFVENTNSKFKKTESELNIANNEIEKTKNELKKTCDETKTEINNIESKIERSMTTKLNDNENTIKSDFNKQLAIKDNEITKLYTKFTELERSFTTNLNDIELFKVNLRKEFEKSLEKTKTEFTKQLSLKDIEIAKLNDEMVRQDTKITQELENIKSEFSKQLAFKDKEIVKLSAKACKSDEEIKSNVGIVAMEVYFPNTFVAQTDLEKHDQVSQGKYTIGLGQNSMAFVSDREDINSICLTVTKSLLEKYSISPKEVGFLMIGTETIIDKSKSVNTILMDLFEDSGNTDIEGTQSTNACYGGTAALFHAINWIKSSAWDGRYAIVVAADIALYAKGAARPTGGCAAVAMLIGTDAAIIFDRKLRATHMSNVYDFYKPDMKSEYPIVDGPLSNQCYLAALDRCFQLYFEKADKFNANASLNGFDGILFHAPYCKLVQKSLGRLILLEFLRDSKSLDSESVKQLEKYRNVNLEDTYNDLELQKLLVKLSENIFKTKTDPSLVMARQVGNSYTASLYVCLISFILSNRLDQLVDKKLLLFSYGSGLSASMFSARVSPDASAGSALTKLHAALMDIPQILNARIQVTPIKYEKVLEDREKTHNMAPYKPNGDLSELRAGTYFLADVSDKHKRKYNRV